MQFLFPQPTNDVLSSIYSSTYFLGSRNEESEQRQEVLKRATARLYLDAIVPLVQQEKPKLLEIGCGAGDFLIEAQRYGFDVEGLEYSQHAADTANARLGKYAVRVGSPEDECLLQSTYDVVGAFDVIEHLRDPRRALEYLRTALKPQGLLAIVTPSLDSWSHRMLGRYWMEYKTEHFTYFTKRSLAQILEATGFEKVQFFPNYKTLSFDYISSHFNRFPVPVVSPVVRLLRKALPDKWSYRPVNIVASGTMVVARRVS